MNAITPDIGFDRARSEYSAELFVSTSRAPKDTELQASWLPHGWMRSGVAGWLGRLTNRRTRGSPRRQLPGIVDYAVFSCDLFCGCFEAEGRLIQNRAGEATKIELYVPTITPTTREKAKAWIAWPPAT